jgi:hypothetical protein
LVIGLAAPRTAWTGFDGGDLAEEGMQGAA